MTDAASGSPVRIGRRLDRSAALQAIKLQLTERGQSLPEAIGERKLYFRVSVIGSCNLSCRFCHNEGAPKSGRLRLHQLDPMFQAAATVGFTRVQFTGGEPLLNLELPGIVSTATEYFDDVGLTTNGTYLAERLPSLVQAGLQRIHISLQTETLVAAGSASRWGVPAWLLAAIKEAEGAGMALRVNLPVPASALQQAAGFLRSITGVGISVKAFSILPDGGSPYPVEELHDLAASVNKENSASPRAGRVEVRGYIVPSGVRCGSCSDRGRCSEQSHSLRLGSDLALRPCLATRAWDSPLRLEDMEGSLREAALLSLDYRW